MKKNSLVIISSWYMATKLILARIYTCCVMSQEGESHKSKALKKISSNNGCVR